MAINVRPAIPWPAILRSQRIALPRLPGAPSTTQRKRAAIALAAVALASLAAYVVARETSAFAVRRIDVVGAKGSEAARVRAVLRPVLGSSPVAVDADDIGQRLSSLPTVASWSYDRAFPHSVRVAVRIERPLAVVRRGRDSWLVSVHGRVLRSLPRRRLPRLPRIWVEREVRVTVGGALSGPGRRALAAPAPLAGDPLLRRIMAAKAGPDGGVTIVARSGVQIEIGALRETRMKLEIARRLLPGVVRAGETFLDVSVPARPVSGTSNPQPAT